MSKLFFLITFTIITCSLTKSAKIKTDDIKRNNEDVTPSSTMPSTTTAYQENSNSRSELDPQEVMNECNETFRIEMDDLKSLNNTGSFPDETDKTPKCFLRCVLENMDVVSKEGQFNPARAAVLFAGERGGKAIDDIQDIASLCAERRETCKCERSYNFLKCLMTMEIEEYESK